MTQPSRGSLLRINLLLMALGAVVGVLAAIPLTWLGKAIAQAPDPATLANYLWNMRVFGIMGAFFGPALGWTVLRRAPLWRAALEPALGGLVGATVGLFLGTGSLFFLTTASGVALAAWRLNRRYQDVLLIERGTEEERKVVEP